MSAMVSPRMAAVPRKRFAKATLRGEGARKFLADLRLGPVIARAIQLAGLTYEQAAGEMGYGSASTLSRWISNEEPPHLARLWSAPTLRAALVAALAEAAGHAVEVETSIRIRRRA